MTATPRPRCGNDPRAQLTDGDRQAVADFKAYLAARAALRDRIAEALRYWVHPTDRGTAADAVLAVLPAPVDRAAVLNEAADALEGRRCSPESVDVVQRLVHERLCTDCKGYGQTATPTEDGGIVRRCRPCDGKGLRRMAVEAQPAVEAPRLPDCPSDCPCRRVCIGRTHQPAAEAQPGTEAAALWDELHRRDVEADQPHAVEAQPTQPQQDELRCVCGDPVQLMDDNDPTSWIHSPGSDTRCLEARPRCPHCQMPHAMTPQMFLMCASIRASIRDRDAAEAQQDGAQS